MDQPAKCVFCDLDLLRPAKLFLENDLAVYASTRDPRDALDVLPGCGVIVPRAHKRSPFDFTADEWAATRDLLLKAKDALDDWLAPDGYVAGWNVWPEIPHAHMHLLPRFDDEPFATAGIRYAFKHPDNSAHAALRPRSRDGHVPWGPLNRTSLTAGGSDRFAFTARLATRWTSGVFNLRVDAADNRRAVRTAGHGRR